MCSRRCFWFASLALLAVTLAVPLAGCQQSEPPKKPAKPVVEPQVTTPTEEVKSATEAPVSEAPPAVTKKAESKPEPKTKTEPKPEPKPEPKQVSKFEVKVPLGLPPVPIPDNNPMTAEKVELGKMLYFDKRVSKDGTVSCATCHDPKMAWAEHAPTSTGIGSQVGGRNSPTVINSAYATSQFWDGRAKTLEEQAVGPVGNPIEMGHTMTGGRRTASIRSPSYQGAVPEGLRHGRDRGWDSPRPWPLSSGPCSAATRRTTSSQAGDDKAAMSEAAQRKDARICSMEAGLRQRATMQTAVQQLPTTRTPASAWTRRSPTWDVWTFTKQGRVTRAKLPHPHALRDVASHGSLTSTTGVSKTLEEAVALMAAGGKDNPNLSEMLKEVRAARSIDGRGAEGPRRVPQGPFRRVPDRRAAGVAVAVHCSSVSVPSLFGRG